ncbi:MAG TPA: DUF3311 domain-containing protein [Vicinamibacterales bacterium]|nr:DUF3311 domain-containing protein [Vicinamibacterales bacterium]
MSFDPDRPTPLGCIVVGLLFLVVAVVALWVPLYNRAEPALFGVPFFYWFQMVWILAGAGATALAYRLRV